MKPPIDQQAALARMLDGLPARPLTVHLSRALERRLQRTLDDYAEEDETVDPSRDSELALTLLCVADGGLDRAEADDGVYATPDGLCHLLPRARRAPVRLRVRFAWRAAVTAWRST